MFRRFPFSFITTVILAATLTGCSTMPKTPTEVDPDVKANLLSSLTNFFKPSDQDVKLNAAREQHLPLTHADRRQDLETTHERVMNSTDAILFSDNRVKIMSEGALIGSNERSELDFFIRSATEALNAGYDGFVIVHLDYHNPGPQFLPLTPSISLSSDRWIGTYEQFLVHRNEQNLFAKRSSVNRKVRQGVILLVKDEQFPNRERFNATEIYFNLIEARYAL